MKPFFTIVLIALVIYVGSYSIFRSAHIETYSKDHTRYVIYPAEDYIYKMFRPLAYVDERFTNTKSHIGPHDTAAATDFQENGVLEHDQEGMKPGVWYLIYQNSAGSSDTIELSGVPSSFFIGDRVTITGTKQNDRVTNSRIAKQQ